MSTDSVAAIEARAAAVVATTSGMLRDLVDLRDKHDLTQAELAERMGVSQPSVAAFERYDANPTVASIVRYAVAVGARLDLTVVDDYDDQWDVVLELPARSGTVSWGSAAGSVDAPGASEPISEWSEVLIRV